MTDNKRNFEFIEVNSEHGQPLQNKKQKISTDSLTNEFNIWLRNVKSYFGELSEDQYCDKFKQFANKKNLYKSFVHGESYQKVASDLLTTINADYKNWIKKIDDLVLTYVGTERSKLFDYVDIFRSYVLNNDQLSITKIIYFKSYNFWYGNILNSLNDFEVPLSFFLQNDVQKKIMIHFNLFTSVSLMKNMIKLYYVISNKNISTKSAQIDKIIFDVTKTQPNKLPKEFIFDYIRSIDISNANLEEIKKYVSKKWTYYVNTLTRLRNLCDNCKQYNFEDLNTLDLQMVNFAFDADTTTEFLAKLMYSTHWKNKIEKDFYFWIKNTNKLVFDNTNLNLSELPDEPFRNYFNEGLNSKSMADLVINNLNESFNFFLELF